MLEENKSPLTERELKYGPTPEWFNQRVQDGANDDDWAGRYNRDNWREQEEPPQSMKDFIGEHCPPGYKVLDQGCGNGRG